MSDRIAIRISDESHKVAEAWAKKREVEVPEMLDRLIGAGYKRHLALKNHAERPRDKETGLVKKRLTEGGNKAGWLKRKARRET